MTHSLRYRDDSTHEEPAVTLEAFLGQSNATAVRIEPSDDARALLPLDGAQQILAAGDVVARKLSVREAEKLVNKLQHQRQQPLLRVAKEKPRDVARI